MWLNEESPLRKQELILTHPFVNAPGTLGFAPDRQASSILPGLGAFITNPISRRSRKPASNRCCLEFSGGFLLHTGHPNPGISRAISRYKQRWAGAPLPIIIHLLAETPETAGEMVGKIESLENILALELGLSPQISPDDLEALFDAASGELPVVITINPQQIPTLLEIVQELQPAAVHLVEPRGTLPGPDGEMVTGRLFGPAIFPLMLQAAQTLVTSGLRVIADGGCVTRWQVEALKKCCVTAVGLGAGLWQLNSSSLFDDP